MRLRAEGELDSARIAAKLRDALASLGLDDPEVSVVVVTTIDRQAIAGKSRRFVPLAR